MDPQVPTSFIPKKPLVGEASRGGAMGLVTLLAAFLFVASVVAAGGAFAYGKYLNLAVASKDVSLKKAEGAFDTRSIQDLERLDSRLGQARVILQKHVAPSGLFTFLAAATLEQVQFTSLSLDVSADGSGKITMGGVADSFSTLALQSDQFSAAKVLKDVIFSGITTDAAGRVVFSVSANVGSGLLSYAKNNGAAPSAVPDASAATPAQ